MLFRSSIVIGASKPAQLQDNLGAVDVSLSAEEMQQLDMVSELPKEYPGWVLERTEKDRVADKTTAKKP